jgi:hypothetical protein
MILAHSQIPIIKDGLNYFDFYQYVSNNVQLLYLFEAQYDTSC